MDPDAYQWINMPNDRLPTITECVLSIVAVSPTNGTPKQSQSIGEMSAWLHTLWAKSFDDDKIQTRQAIRKKLTQYLKSYSSMVQKKKGSKRLNFKDWQSAKNTRELFDLKKS